VTREMVTADFMHEWLANKSTKDSTKLATKTG